MGEVLDLEVLQPQVRKVVEGAVGSQHPGRSERRPREQPLLEQRDGAVRAGAADPDLPQPSVSVADPGLS